MQHPTARSSIICDSICGEKQNIRGGGTNGKPTPATPPPLGSHALWPTLLVLLAFGHDGCAEAGTQIVRQFVELGVAVDLDGFLRSVTNYVAVVAPGKTILQLDFRGFVEDAVQILGQLVQKFRAFHWSPSPLSRLWKNRPKRSRNCRRARNNRDFTAGTLKSRAAAVSSVESPSTSLSTNTVRKPGGRPWIVLLKISRNSAWLYCCSGFGLQSAISRGKESSSVFMSSSSETVRSGFLRRNFINASLTAMRTSHV